MKKCGIPVVGLFLAATLGLCLAAAGCTGKAPKQTQFMKTVGGVGMTSEALRYLVRDGAEPYAGVIEDAADEIMAQTDDPEIRRRALMWKARAIPVANIALFQEDPLVAAIDTWAFTYQMRHFFEEGHGKGGFGDLQPIAIEACDRLDAGMENLAAAAANEKANLPRVRENLTRFTRDYPIHSWSFTRETVPAHLDAFERTRAAGGLAAAGKLASDMSDISARVGLLASQMPKQAAWEAELLMETYVRRDQVDRALADLTDIPESVDRLRLFAEESADLVLQEKDALLESLGGEDSPLLKTYEGTLAFITKERVAVIDELKSERAMVLEAIQAERAILVETLQAERALVLDEVNLLADGAIGSLSTQIEGAIDHFFLRLVQLLAVLVVVGFGGGFLLVRAVRRQPA